MRRRHACALALLLLLVSGRAVAADLKFPPLTGRVVDSAGVLSPATISHLDAMLAQHEHTSGEQVVVATLDSLQGDTIEDYGYQLGRILGHRAEGQEQRCDPDCRAP